MEKVVFKHFETLNAFNDAKSSLANGDLAFIKDSQLIYTHGLLYNCKDFLETSDLLEDLIKEIKSAIGYSEYEYVDLGLPSGTLWATKNIGAETEYDAGLYFLWGDTQGYTADQVGNGEGKKYFGWDDYKYGKYNSSDTNMGMTKYNTTDGKTTLENEDDAAFAATNGKFKIPTLEQIQELINNTNHIFVNDSNEKYMKFTNKTDESKFIVLPASGGAGNGSLSSVGRIGNYWSSSLYSSRTAHLGGYLFFDNSGYMDAITDIRFYGFSVRGVVNPDYNNPIYRKFDVTNEGTADEDKTERTSYKFDNGTSLVSAERINKNGATQSTQFRDSDGNVEKYAQIRSTNTTVDISASNKFIKDDDQYSTTSQLYDSQDNANINNSLQKKIGDTYKTVKGTRMQAGHAQKAIVSAYQNDYDDSGTYTGATESKIENDAITVHTVDSSDEDIKSMVITANNITSSTKGDVMWENDFEEYTDSEVDSWLGKLTILNPSSDEEPELPSELPQEPSN